MYLIDINVWLERLLDQERGSDVVRFLTRIPSDRLAITDFAFHSIALVLIRLNRLEVLRAFVQDLFLRRCRPPDPSGAERDPRGPSGD